MEDSEEKLILAKLNDKIKFCKAKNKIVNTEFLNLNKRSIVEKGLANFKENNYFFTGGYEDAENVILIIYPEKFSKEIAEQNIKNIMKAIKIVLPNEQFGKYQHKDYLGTIMQFGLERERIGDIIVYDDKAYVIALTDNIKYIRDSLSYTKKFKKAKIDIIEIDEIEVKEKEFDELKITVPSRRLDCFVSELAKISRNESARLIENEFVSVNYKIESKCTKQVDIGDILVIRGKGKFIISEFLKVNRKEKEVIIVKKYK